MKSSRNPGTSLGSPRNCLYACFVLALLFVSWAWSQVVQSDTRVVDGGNGYVSLVGEQSVLTVKFQTGPRRAEDGSLTVNGGTPREYLSVVSQELIRRLDAGELTDVQAQALGHLAAACGALDGQAVDPETGSVEPPVAQTTLFQDARALETRLKSLRAEQEAKGTYKPGVQNNTFIYMSQLIVAIRDFWTPL